MTPDFRNGADLSALKRAKTMLLSRPERRSTWGAIQAAGVGVLLRDAYGENGRPQIEHAIKRAGVGRLKVLLGERDFGRLMRLRRLSSRAEVPAVEVARFVAPFAAHLSGEPVEPLPTADKAANALIQEFIETAGSGRLVAPILASNPSEEEE